MFCHHELQLMRLVQQKQSAEAIYYAQRYLSELNNIGKDTVLMAIYQVLNRNKIVAKQHIALCLHLYKKIDTGPTLYSQPSVRKLFVSHQLI